MNQIESQADNKEIISVLKSSLYPGASDQSVELVLSYCRQAKLDPMQKPVHIVPMWDSKSGAMRDVVMPGVGLYRIQASRSGECGGVNEPEYGEDVTENIGGVNITYPKWCKVTVSRMVNGNPITFTAKEFWKENYAVKGGKEKSIAPNAMWSKRPYGQIAKCAEAQALRKAFPEVGAQPTAEEMEGKSFLAQEEELMSATNETIKLLNSKSLDELMKNWQELNKEFKGTPIIQSLVKAKDQRKAELTQSESVVIDHDSTN